MGNSDKGSEDSRNMDGKGNTDGVSGRNTKPIVNWDSCHLVTFQQGIWFYYVLVQSFLCPFLGTLNFEMVVWAVWWDPKAAES